MLNESMAGLTIRPRVRGYFATLMRTTKPNFNQIEFMKNFFPIPAGLCRNVQVWLPVGQRVKIVGDAIYRPTTFDSDGNKVQHLTGQIVEHLGQSPYCGVAIKFDTYPNVVDFTNRETANIHAEL